MLKNDYLFSAYGHNVSPRLHSIGSKIYRRSKRRVLIADQEIRHLPKPTDSNNRLLDIGCGSGEFLRKAQELGYVAKGVEPDKAIVASAKNLGLQIQEGSLPAIELPSRSFDQITLSHVIEHVHDPLAAMLEVQRLLAPNGRVWISTPNINAPTHLLFQKHWRGLEAPRHLCLFSRTSIHALLKNAGFTRINFLKHPPVAYFLVSQSLSQMEGSKIDHFKQRVLNHEWQEKSWNIESRQLDDIDEEDFLVVSAQC